MRKCIGIDIAKQYFDMYVLCSRQHHRLDNTAEGVRQCVQVCKAATPELIVMEATGGYE